MCLENKRADNSPFIFVAVFDSLDEAAKRVSRFASLSSANLLKHPSIFAPVSDSLAAGFPYSQSRIPVISSF